MILILSIFVFILLLHIGYRQFSLVKLLTVNNCKCFNATSLNSWKNIALAKEFSETLNDKSVKENILKEASYFTNGIYAFILALFFLVLIGMFYG